MPFVIKDENVRKSAVLALGRIKSSEAIDPLIEMLGDKDWFTRLTAAAALESIGDERGREAIKPLLKDPDMVVKMRVERILAKWKKTARSLNRPTPELLIQQLIHSLLKLVQLFQRHWFPRHNVRLDLP